MGNRPEREFGRWLDQSLKDLDDARFCAQGGRYHLACFLCQQAAEKALKAFLYLKGHQVVWGHSVAELISDAAADDSRFEGLREKGARLDRYYIPTRYPNGLPGGIPSESFSPRDAEEALSEAAAVIEMVRYSRGRGNKSR